MAGTVVPVTRLLPPLLRDPAFRWYFLARTSSHLGDGLIAVALLFGALRLGASPTGVGLVLLAGRLPVVVSRSSAGWWATCCHAVP